MDPPRRGVICRASESYGRRPAAINTRRRHLVRTALICCWVRPPWASVAPRWRGVGKALRAREAITPDDCRARADGLDQVIPSLRDPTILGRAHRVVGDDMARGVGKDVRAHEVARACHRTCAGPAAREARRRAPPGASGDSPLRAPRAHGDHLTALITGDSLIASWSA